MSFKLASSGAITRKAGKNANSTAAASGSLMAELSDEAESFINAYTRYDWTANVATLNANTSGALQEAAANLAAIGLISYDTSGYNTRAEAENIMNVLNYKAFRVLDMIKEDPNRKFVIDGSTGVE